MTEPDSRTHEDGSNHKRVVVVDDSRSIRAWLCQVIGADPRLQVVGQAADANEARQIIKETNPDVITLDIEMPGMSGLEFLRRLIALRPMPVVMVSSLTQRGSEAAVKALSLGAIDCIVKPSSVMDADAQRDLTNRLHAAACCVVTESNTAPLANQRVATPSLKCGNQVVLIGASTGGVGALETVISGLDPNGPPVVIVQHMPGPFLASFADRLHNVMAQDVGLLEEGVPVAYGQIRLAPGIGQHSVFRSQRVGWASTYAPQDPEDLHCPSVDALFGSAVRRAPHVTAAILTGLGKDGAAGLKALRDAGAHTIGQDQASSTVYGMPRAAFEMGAVEQVLPLKDIANAINRAIAKKGLSMDAR